MNGDGLRTCAPVKSIKTSEQVFIGFKNLPTGYYRKLKTSGQSMCSNGRLAIETSVKSIRWIMQWFFVDQIVEPEIIEITLLREENQFLPECLSKIPA